MSKEIPKDFYLTSDTWFGRPQIIEIANIPRSLSSICLTGRKDRRATITAESDSLTGGKPFADASLDRLW